jgi:hypothetical protein
MAVCGGADGSWDVGDDFGHGCHDCGGLLHGAADRAPVWPGAGEVEGVDGVGLEGASGVGVVEADAHEDDAAEGFSGTLFAAEPAVAGLGLSFGGGRRIRRIG